MRILNNVIIIPILSICISLSGCIQVELITPTPKKSATPVCATVTNTSPSDEELEPDITKPSGEETNQDDNGQTGIEEEEFKISDRDEMFQVFTGGVWIDSTEVTNTMYKLCVDEGVCTIPGLPDENNPIDYYENEKYEDRPVVRVSFAQASEYCEWAGRRIPSGEEWKTAE